MAKRIKLEITEAQLRSIIEIGDEWSAMLGNGEPEEVIRTRHLRNLDKMLENNGYKRNYK